MQRFITFIFFFSLFLNICFGISTNDALLSVKQRYANLKARSQSHEDNVKNLLSQPRIQRTVFDLPKLKVAQAQATPSIPPPSPSSFIPIPELPPSPTMSEVVVKKPTDAVYDDLVVDPAGGLEIGGDTNATVDGTELIDAYDDFHRKPIPLRHEGYYFVPLFGFVFPDDGAARSIPNPKEKYDSDNGIILGLQYGRDFGDIRFEGEYHYLKFDADPGFENTAHSFLAHLLFEFELGERADLRAGLGGGLGFVNLEQDKDYSGAGFCYDFIFGYNYRVSDDWSLALDYRYYLTAANDDYDRIKSHMLVLGANYDL